MVNGRLVYDITPPGMAASEEVAQYSISASGSSSCNHILPLTLPDCSTHEIDSATRIVKCSTSFSKDRRRVDADVIRIASGHVLVSVSPRYVHVPASGISPNRLLISSSPAEQILYAFSGTGVSLDIVVQPT